jgi:small subunit ribosomal protein S11
MAVKTGSVKKQDSAKAAAKRAKGRIVTKGRVCVQATFNNTIVTITDAEGGTIAASSAGAQNFKGPRKATPYAAQVVAKEVAQKAKAFGLRSVDIFVKGPGPGRDASVRVFADFFQITSIVDVTGIPHNGCRAQKERRM